MNVKSTWMAVLVAVMASVAGAGERTISLYSVGMVDATMKERVISLVSQQLLPVTNAGTFVPPVQLTLQAVHELGKERVKGNTAAVLVLAEGLTGMGGRRSLAKDKAVVVSVGALSVAGKDQAEQWIRRVEKESMEGLGLMLGMKPCPLFTCVLCASPAMDDLDIKGRGMCPPCMGKWDEAMTKQGDSPAGAGNPRE